MSQTEHLQQARSRALAIRSKYSLTTPRVMVSDLKRILKAEGVSLIEYSDRFRSTHLKGAYFNDRAGITVVINGKIRSVTELLVFTLGHELKHHLMDPVDENYACVLGNENHLLEAGANAFAAELVFPSQVFRMQMTRYGIGAGRCTPDNIVRLKHESKTTLSHMALAVRAEQLGYATHDSLKRVAWNTLRDRLYPEYTHYRRSRNTGRKYI